MSVVIPSQFSYTFPPISLVHSANSESWQSYTPSSGQVFRSDATSVININISSPTEFHSFIRSYLKGTIVARSADGSVYANATTRMTSLGAAAAIQRMVLSVGGTPVEDIPVYPQLLSLIYNLSPLNRKKLLQYFEGYQPAGALNTMATGKATFVHGIQTSLFTQDTHFPTPLVQGGVTLQLYLAPSRDLFTAGTVAYYTLENVSFNCQTITCHPDLMLKYMSGLEAGKSLYIPFCEVRTFTNYGNGGTQQQWNLNLGNKRSIQSFAMMFRNESDISDVTKDQNQIYNSANLRNWQMQIAGKIDPVVRAFSYNPTNTDFDPEAAALSIISADNTYTADIDFDPATFDAKNFSLRYNFKGSNEVWGDGIDTTIGPGVLTVTTNHSAPVPATVRVTSFVFIDSVLEIRKDLIGVNWTW
jgi:hypothetical protein